MEVEPKSDEPPAIGPEMTPSSSLPGSTKIDSITALQDSVDSLSLAMFEALRGLRDAVAPESGNLGGNNGNSTNNESSEPDFEDFWQSYRNGDAETVALVRKVSPKTPQTRDEFVQIHARVEMEKDAELVHKLAQTVLEKSANIDDRVSSLPGLHRTRTQQMEYIEELLQKNHEESKKLAQAYDKASQRRKLVRQFVKESTCAALGIVEEGR